MQDPLQYTDDVQTTNVLPTNVFHHFHSLTFLLRIGLPMHINIIGMSHISSKYIEFHLSFVTGVPTIDICDGSRALEFI